MKLWLLDGKRVELAAWEPCAERLAGPDVSEVIALLEAVRTAPEPDGRGYGESPLDALSDLQASVEQYLEVLRDGAELAPRVRHHADFLPLLDVPRGSWFAAVRPPGAEDAPDLE